MNLYTHTYQGFRGVDFCNDNVSLDRSPDALNMWKNYKESLGNGIETRPDIELVDSYDNTIFGLFFYKVGNIEMQIVHCGVKLYKVIDNAKELIYEGMKPAKSQSFIFNNIFYIKDGINYLRFDGEKVSEVVGYIPTTSISRKPLGGGTIYEDVNMLSPYRINTFVGDGKSTNYYLDAKELDLEIPEVYVNDKLMGNGVDYTFDNKMGLVTFKVAPSEPLTVGQDNVKIKFKRTVPGYADRIKKCTLLSVFDNRVFFSGNIDYPNVLWHCSLNDPTYCSDLDYYNEGQDLSKVKALVAGNNALWVFKEPSQSNTTIFYHNPVIDSQYGKVYPSSHSSISVGCIATGINFNDDITFFSDRGMESISGDIASEQVVAHRSSLIDSKLLSEENYKDMILEEWEGYLLIIIDNKIYLADSRAVFQNTNHIEYDFFYWELSKKITCTTVKDNILYLGTEEGIYKLTNNSNNRNVISYWTTPKDEYGYHNYQKTTNKRGCVIDLEGEHIDVSVKTDNSSFELINKYENVNGYVVSRIKKKKWKYIQLKFSSNQPFLLNKCTLESFIGGYIKR